MSAASEHPTRLISPDGELRIAGLTDDEQVALWGHCLHEGAPGRIEVAAGTRTVDGTLRMRSRSAPSHFPAAGDLQALTALVRAHRDVGEEVFATPLTRREARSGKAGGILPGRVAWVDIDDPAQLAALRAFAVRPHLVLYSGSGGAHAYWVMAEPLAAAELEAANRKLAAHLGADQGATDRARIMRLPGTHNHKANRPCRLVYCDLAGPAVDADGLTAGMCDPSPPPPAPTPSGRARYAAAMSHDPAASITPPTYFRVLAGIEVPARGGHVLCPLHEEQVPSCMVYPTPQQGWRCFGGCEVGGRIYDLASLLAGGPWGRELREERFLAARQTVYAAFGLTTQASNGVKATRPRAQPRPRRGGPRARSTHINERRTP